MKNVNLRIVLLGVIALNYLWLATPSASCDDAGNVQMVGQGHVFLRHGRNSCQQSCRPCCTGMRVTQAITAPSSPPSATVHEDGAAAPPTKDPELKALLEARRDALKELMRIQSEGFVKGTARVNRFPESVTLEYLEVQLELAESKEERVAALEEALASFTSWENLAKTKLRIGLAPYAETPVVGAARLKVEIMLHKEKKRE